jgi:hypothetical protein
LTGTEEAIRDEPADEAGLTDEELLPLCAEQLKSIMPREQERTAIILLFLITYLSLLKPAKIPEASFT